MAETFLPTIAQQKAIKLLADDRHRHILLFGGARSGKTFVLVYAVLVRAIKYPSRHAIVRRQFKDVWESVGMDTLPKVLNLCFPDLPYIMNGSRYYIQFPHNGSEVWFSGLDDKNRADKILGKEFSTLYFNECSEITWSSVETALSRLAQKNSLIKRCYYDCNPTSKSHWSYRLFIEKCNPNDGTPLNNADVYAHMRLNPSDNQINISDDYIENILRNLSARERKRFLEGEWQGDNVNALWKRDGMINPYRVAALPADLDRVVVGVDPAATGKETSDLTGIVIASCKRIRGEVHYFVLDDRSLRGTPNEWASAVVNAYREYEADRVVAEVNQGGDMVEQTLRNIDRRIAYRGVRATRGKLVRAEPIAALYERGLVHHVGEFPLLEDEMCNYCGYENEKSPDRMDALVWALTELSRSSGASYPILAQ